MGDKINRLEGKITIFGYRNCGKTSLLYSYKNNKFLNEGNDYVLEDYESVIEVDPFTSVKFTISDTDTLTMLNTKNFATDNSTDFMFVCYNIDSRVSFSNIIKKYMKRFYNFKRFSLFLIGCKSDLRRASKLDVHNKDYVSFSEGIEMKIHIGALAFFECSSKKYQNIQEVFITAAKLLQLNNRKSLLEYYRRLIDHNPYSRII